MRVIYELRQLEHSTRRAIVARADEIQRQGDLLMSRIQAIGKACREKGIRFQPADQARF